MPDGSFSKHASPFSPCSGLFFSCSRSSPLSACGPNQTDPAPDGAPELADPDADTPLDVDPLSRQDDQSSDEAVFDSARTGQEIGDTPIEAVEPPPNDPEANDMDQ